MTATQATFADTTTPLFNMHLSCYWQYSNGCCVIELYRKQLQIQQTLNMLSVFTAIISFTMDALINTWKPRLFKVWTFMLACVQTSPILIIIPNSEVRTSFTLCDWTKVACEYSRQGRFSTLLSIGLKSEEKQPHSQARAQEKKTSVVLAFAAVVFGDSNET